MTLGKLIVIYCIVMVLFVGMITFVLLKGCEIIEKKGLKTIATDIWEGESDD